MFQIFKDFLDYLFLQAFSIGVCCFGQKLDQAKNFNSFSVSPYSLILVPHRKCRFNWSCIYHFPNFCPIGLVDFGPKTTFMQASWLGYVMHIYGMNGSTIQQVAHPRHTLIFLFQPIFLFGLFPEIAASLMRNQPSRPIVGIPFHQPERQATLAGSCNPTGMPTLPKTKPKGAKDGSIGPNILSFNDSRPRYCLLRE